jgi:hypothetical protein
MKLTEAQIKAFLAVEAATDLSHSDIHKALNDQLNDLHPNDYACVMDVYGDDGSGDVVYQHQGQVYKAPYTLGTSNGKRTAEIDEDSKLNVVPRTVYDEEADDDDSYASMESATKTAKLYTSLPTYERFIGKAERDGADASDFAGKGKSYPILKPGDVMAAVRSMGRAGSDNVGTSTLKSNIIKIAKRKGWTKYLPKAWQGGSDASEALRNAKGELVLVESAVTLDTIKLVEAKADYEIKLIAPGKGSSAFYPKEVLQRDGPKVFKQGTHVYLNHPTAAEEAQRPEGDVKNLAGVLTSDAAYHESHAKGPGLYARMKVFADHAQTVEAKAPHVGMSIRASGKAESKQTKDGLPVLTELTGAESVDVVTRAGAGGMILTESAAGAANNGEIEMTAQEVQKLVEAGVRKATLPDTARREGLALLEGVKLPDAAKTRIVERAVKTLDLDKDFDQKTFGETVAKEAKAEAEYLATVMPGAGRVLGMGAAPVEVKPKEVKRQKKELKEARRETVDVFESLMFGSNAQHGDEKSAERARQMAKFATAGRAAVA